MNSVHWARVKDQSRIRKGSPTRPLAAVTNLAVSILVLLRTTNIKRRMWQLHLDPNPAVAVLFG